LETADDVKVGNAIAIAKGAVATGHVLAAQRKGGWGKSGQLEFSVEYVKAVDGNNVRLRATSSQGGNQGAIRPAMVLGVGGLLIHGKDINVAKGTTMSAYVDGDRDIVASSLDRTTPL